MLGRTSKPSSSPTTTSSPSINEEKAIDGPSPGPAMPSFPDGGTKAWLVVLGAMIVNGCSFGYASSFGVYQAYYQLNQLSTKTPSTIAWIGSLQIFFLFAGGFFSGPLFDRFGARRLMIPATIGYVLALMFVSLCKEYWQFVLAQGVLGGFCNGLLFSPAVACVGQYFNKKRGAAMGLLAVGSSIGGVLFPIVLEQAFYSKLGFAWGVRATGLVMLVLLLIACALIEERLPGNGKFRFFAPESLHNRTYILIVLGIFFILWGIFVVYFFAADYGLSIGMSQSMSFYLVAIINGVSLFGRAIFGILGDKVGFLLMLGVVSAINGVLVFIWTQTHNNVGLIVWGAFFGFASGGIFALFTAALVQAVPNPRDIGTWLGQAMLFVSIAALTGSPISGEIVLKYGFFHASIWSGLCLLVGAAFMLMAFDSQRRAKSLAK